MRLAIADPPYLGRSERWYGTGRGSGRGLHKADTHPEAGIWDDPAAHRDLVARLDRDFDGWAIAAASDTLPMYLAAAPSATVAIWHKRNGMPSGSRIINRWEPVILRVPDSRLSRSAGLMVGDVLDAPHRRSGFVGSKPPEWTAWILAMLGHHPDDEVLDLFPGSGAVLAATDGLLAIPS